MTEVAETPTLTAFDLLAAGRRNLAVRDYSTAASTLAEACEALAKEYGESAYNCAEAYLWYGKALLGLAREESGVFGEKIPGPDAEEEGNNDQESGDDQEENGEETNGDVDDKADEAKTAEEVNADAAAGPDEPGPSNSETNGETNGDADESAVDEIEDDVDNLQLAWEMLDLARSIYEKKVSGENGDTGKAFLADVYLALGEVALESETYDKAVVDMLSCLELQKQIYRSDDRRVAETHYQIGLANSLASNFDDAITHFKNAANILETRLETLKNSVLSKDAKLRPEAQRPDSEIKELEELIPEIKDKIQDMMDYKAETVKKVREALSQTNGSGSSTSNGAGPSTAAAAPKAATNISHLVKRKRKSSENETSTESAPKRSNT